jgi:hypothetical protein
MNIPTIKTTREILKTPLRVLPKGYPYNYNTKWVALEDYEKLKKQLETIEDYFKFDKEATYFLEQLKQDKVEK